MIRAQFHLAFAGGSVPPWSFDREIVSDEARNPEGEKSVTEQLALELRKEFLVGQYHDELPDLSALKAKVSQTFSLDDIATGAYFDRRNTRWVWFEIEKNLILVEFLLAEARAYKAVEPPRDQSVERNNDLYLVHSKKMERFNLATFYLAKIEDLVVRLVFENVGASLVPIDFNDPDWERHLTWNRLKEGLKQHPANVQNRHWGVRFVTWAKRKLGRSAGNPHLEALTEREYRELTETLGQFRSPQFVQKFVGYRNRLAHRITPSVDYAEMYTYLEDRRGKVHKNPAGAVKSVVWAIGGRPKGAEYSFLDLYAVAVSTLEHWVSLLAQLKSVPRFSPEATR